MAILEVSPLQAVRQTAKASVSAIETTRSFACCLSSCILRLLFYLRASGTDLGQVVGAQDADRVDHHCERDHQLDCRRDELARLQGDSAHNDYGLGDTLAAQRRQKGREDAIRQRGKETSHHSTEVECRRQYDNILRVQHFCLLSILECFLSPQR